MPHYADGTPAEIGDTIRGKGYNIHDDEGNLKEITGTLLDIREGDQCNLTLAVVEVRNIPETPQFAMHFGRAGGVPVGSDKYATLQMEYGQTDHFVKV